MLWNSNKYTTKTLLRLVTHILRLFVNVHSSFLYNTWKNNTRKYDTEGFVYVTSLNDVVGLTSSFLRYLIGRNRRIWSVVYMNEKWIYASKHLALTISECGIVRNVLRVTSTCLFIYWCYGAANVKWTAQVWYSSLNSVEVNCDPTSDETISKSHHPN